MTTLRFNVDMMDITCPASSVDSYEISIMFDTEKPLSISAAIMNDRLARQIEFKDRSRSCVGHFYLQSFASDQDRCVHQATFVSLGKIEEFAGI